MRRTIILKKNNNPKKYKYILPGTGLGDRLANILTVCAYANINNLEIIFIWQNSERFNYDINDVFKFITFPEKYIFLTKENRDTKLLKELSIRGQDFYHGFDILPETAHKLALVNNRLNCTLNEYLTAYKNSVDEIKINFDTDNKDYIAVHCRRGDKLEANNKFLPDKLLNEIKKDKINKYMILSDEQIPIELLNLHNILKPNYNIMKGNKHNYMLTDMLYLIKSKKIFSIHNDTGWYGGWSSFSFIASKLGNNNLVSFIHDNTRYDTMKRYIYPLEINNWSIIRF